MCLILTYSSSDRDNFIPDKFSYITTCPFTPLFLRWFFGRQIKYFIMLRLTLLFTLLLLSACAQNKAKTVPAETDKDTNRALIRQNDLRETKRIALIIGNSDYAGGYSGTALKNPVNDEKDLAKKLKSLNFNLVNNKALLDANKQQIERAVKLFTQELKQGSLGLFFYAGHGMQIDGINYLIPLDAEFKSKADVKYSAVNLY